MADCFKYRNKIGLDVALEALKECRASRRCEIDDLWHHAKALPGGERDETLSGGHERMTARKINMAASVRQRLLNRAREQREDFGLLLTRLGTERLLYRLGESENSVQRGEP